MRRTPELLFLACAVLIPSRGVAAPRVSVWPVDALVKVFPDDAPGANRAAARDWLVARNGHASVQFALRAVSAIDSVEVTVSLPGALQTQVRRVGYVPVRANPPKSPLDELIRRAPGRFPDPLIEGSSFPLAAGETSAVWITVYAPAQTRPGVYRGAAVFRSGKQRLARVPLRIRVARAIVPAKQTLKVTNWFNLSEEFLSRHYDLGASGGYWDALGNIARVIADHKQNVILTPILALTEPRLTGGDISYDFSRLDRWVEIFTAAGAADVIEGGHLLGRVRGYNSPLTVAAFVVENGEVRRQSLSPDDPRAEAHVASFLAALYAHLKEKGWLGRYVQHVLDEAHGAEPPAYLRYVGLVRKAMPGVRTIDAIDQTADLLGDACDLWVPQLGRFDNRLDAIRGHVQKGGEAWYYTCLYPQGRYMNRFIDQPLLKSRLLHWFNFRYDFTGFLHWGGNHWPADPFADPQPPLQDGTALPAGDAFITYPWREANSLHSSVRLEAMREGIEDYELLRSLALKNPALARELAAKAVRGFTDYEREVSAFRRLQAELYGSR